MKIYDISMTICEGMPVYKGKLLKKPRITVESTHGTGTSHESRIDMNLHTGTHADAPLHMMDGGATIDEIDLTKFVCMCRVVDCTEAKNSVDAKLLAGKDIGEGEFVLLKTRNSLFEILEGEYVYLDASGADFLKERKIKGVGIDALGIERSQPEHETHLLLMNEGIAIIEGLRLAEVDAGEYLLSAAPLKIKGAEAAPVRAYLIKGISFI